MIAADEYAAWLEHPVTRWVMLAMDAQAEAQREAWIERSWVAGKAEPEALAELRVRADTLKAMREADYFDLCAALEQEPVIDSR